MRNLVKMFGALLLTSSAVFAADNSIYINQIGSTSDFDIKQDGSGNKLYGVGDSQGTPAIFSGSSQEVDIRQIGSSNLLGIDVQSDVASGVGIDLTYTITGSNSVASIDINGDGGGTAANNTISINQTGDYSDLIFDLLGSDNYITASTNGGTLNDLTFDIDADDLTIVVGVTGGGGNKTTMTLGTDVSTVDYIGNGASNQVTLTQSGTGGSHGHNFDLDITGSSNTVTTTQSGNAKYDTDINITGSTNTWSITQEQ